jgi:hypothetical protein
MSLASGQSAICEEVSVGGGPRLHRGPVSDVATSYRHKARSHVTRSCHNSCCAHNTRDDIHTGFVVATPLALLAIHCRHPQTAESSRDLRGISRKGKAGQRVQGFVFWVIGPSTDAGSEISES